MATRKQFCDEMEEVYKGHGVYIGTGNGELTEKLTIGKIHDMEVNYGYAKATTDKNIRRDLAYIGKCYENGYDMSKSRAGDCSGQVVGCLRRLKVIPETADYSCRTFIKAAKTVDINKLQAGDLVFNKAQEPSHMGVYVGNGYVIESKGRDDGVVKRKTSAGGWVIGGRLDWFEDGGDDKVLTRILKYIPDDPMKGDDVEEVQKELKLQGYNCGSADGVFGKKTKTAVQAFQLEHNLTADGIVGRKTAEALGFKWEG